MSKLNQEAPPAAAPLSEFIKMDPFPKSDTVVLTVVAINYLPKCTFDRTDAVTKKDYTVEAPGVEFFFGAMVNGKPYIIKTWPKMYSLSDRATYYKYYEAVAGVPPSAGTKPQDLIGMYALGTIKNEEKVSKKGTKYTASTLKSLTPVPDILKSTGTPLAALLPALEAILAGDAKEEAPF